MLRSSSMKACCVGAAFGLTLAGMTQTIYAQCEATETDQINASDGQFGMEFGASSTIDGNTIIVGAPKADALAGAAYIYLFDGMSWNEEPRLVVSDAAPADQCGHAVAVDGDVAVIGAPNHQHGKPIWAYAGSVYVLRFNGSSWVEEQELLASNIAAGQFFGWAVAVQGNVIVVGAVGVNDFGAAYVFRYNGLVWEEEAILTASDPANFDLFGTSVALDSGVALVGAIRHDDDGVDSGSAYVFRHQGGLIWDQEAKLSASDAVAGDMFGASVSLSGNVAFVAANNADTGWDTGAAYVFRYSEGTWSEEQKITAPAGTSDPSEFAFAVAVDGNVALVGAVRDEGAMIATGTAYVYAFNGSSWTEQAKLAAANGAANDRHGWSLALAGEIAIVGAAGVDDSEGSAYIYDGLGDGMPDQCQAAPCPWDLGGDGSVGINDFLELLAAWGTDPGGPPDFDGDHDVGINDFLELLANWGDCP